QLCSRAPEKGLRWENFAATLDVPSSRGGIEKNPHASQSKHRNQRHVKLRRHRVQHQNAVALLQARALQLPRNPRGRVVQFAKTIRTVAISMNIDDGRVVAHLSNTLQ